MGDLLQRIKDWWILGPRRLTKQTLIYFNEKIHGHGVISNSHADNSYYDFSAIGDTDKKEKDAMRRTFDRVERKWRH